MLQLAVLVSSPTEGPDLITGRLLARSADATPQIKGLVVSDVLSHLTESADARRLIQIWYSESSNDGLSALEAIVQSSECSDATINAWGVEELVFRAPIERESIDASLQGVKMVNTAYKRDDLTLDAFFNYWERVHAPISAKVPGFGGYVVSRVTEQVIGDHRPDALCELWFPNQEAFEAFEGSQELADAEVDTARYAKMTGTTWLMKETVLVPPPATGPGTLELGTQ